MRRCWSILGEVFLTPRFFKPHIFPFTRVEKGFTSGCSKLRSAVPSYRPKLHNYPAQAVAKHLSSGQTDRFDTTPSRVRYDIMAHVQEQVEGNPGSFVRAMGLGTHALTDLGKSWKEKCGTNKLCW